MSYTGTCNSNNVYVEFPALMSDSRIFTLYDPSKIQNENVMNKMQIESNYEYRQFLIHNGDFIRKQFVNDICHQCNYSQFDNNHNNIHNNKYLFKGNSDTMRPYGYNDSDLKSQYLSRQSLNSRLSAPLMSQYQLLEYMRDK